MRKLMLITSLLIVLVLSMPFTFAATLSLTYDANGNLITGDGKYREYDGFNHLVLIRDGNNATGNPLENYTWHATEERIVIKDVYLTNGSWKETVYYPSKELISVENASGVFDYKYIYQNGQLVAQELAGGPKHFMLNDHKGSVAVVVNSSGAAVEETFYSPFGEIISGGATSRFDYEGKEYDSVVGDYDYHARKVNPAWGMFTSPDTMLPNVYDPQQLNRYAFEGNNPQKNVDENGHYWQIPVALGLSSAISELAVQLIYTHRVYSLSRIGVAAGQGVLAGTAAVGAIFIPYIGPILSAGILVGWAYYSEYLGLLESLDAAEEYNKKKLENIGGENPKETDPLLKDSNINNPNNQLGLNQGPIPPSQISIQNAMTIGQRIESAISRLNSWLTNGGSGGSGGSGSNCGPEGCIEQIGNQWHLIWVEPVDNGEDSSGDDE